MIDGSWLVMSQGPQPGQTFMLDRDWLTTGRDPSNDIVISDPQISRQHARITRQGKLIVIEDLGSTNGTFVNGMRLTGPHVMVNGDVIGLGDAVTLTFYEVGIATDATETVVGRGTAAPRPTSYPPPSGRQPSPQPGPQPAPSPAYVAVSPPPPVEPPAEEKKKSRTWLYVGCGVLMVVVACVVVALLLWYAPESFWLTLQSWGIPIPARPF